MSLGSFASLNQEDTEQVHETIEVCGQVLRLKVRPSAVALMQYGLAKRSGGSPSDIAIIALNATLVLSHLEAEDADKFDKICDLYSVSPEQLEEIAKAIFVWGTNFPIGQPSSLLGGGSKTSTSSKGGLWDRLSQDLKPVESLDLDLGNIVTGSMS